MSAEEQLRQRLWANIESGEVPITSFTMDELGEMVFAHNPDLVEECELMEKKISGTEKVQQEMTENCGYGEGIPNIVENAQDRKESTNTTSDPGRTIEEVQQEMAENCGYREEIIWDLLSSDCADVMKMKIKQLIPDQKKCQEAIEKIRENIFNSVWAQRKYTNGTSVTSIFYVMVTKDTNFNTAVYSKEFSCHPVFRCKKCDNDFSSSNCCMIYVDETGRVYENWRSFINENVLPAGTMVTPRNGIYNFNKHNNVILEIYSTPKGRTGAKIMDVAMKCTSLAGFGAAGASLAASVVAAPAIATAAGAVSLGVGTFSSITSFMYLKDRKKHEQSINIKDKEAQSSYLNLLGGVLGVAAAGASRALTSLASAGKATTGIEMLVNGINISSIVLSGNNVVNGVLDLIMKYSDGEKITSIDILQLSASLVIFTHSLYNFQLASRIANDARVNSMKAYRQTLSNRQKKMFDKISKETIRIRGSTQGKMDVIRGMNEIPDRQYLNDLYKINKQLNNHNVRPAYGESGQGIILNNELPVDTAALRQNVQHQRGPNILEQVSQPIPTTYNSDTYITTTPKASRLLYWTGRILRNINLSDPFLDNKNSKLNHIDVLRNLIISLPDGCVILLRQYGDQFLNKIADGYKFQDVILFIADKLKSDVFKFLMDLAKQFIEDCLENIERIIGIFISTESVLFNILKRFLIKNIKHITESRKILEDLEKYYLSLNPNNNSNLLNICPDCNGKFFKCQL